MYEDSNHYQETWHEKFLTRVISVLLTVLGMVFMGWVSWVTYSIMELHTRVMKLGG